MENIVCQFCHQLLDESVLLQCKHPICSMCVQTQFSSERLRTPCDQFPLKTEHKHKEGKQEIHDAKNTVNICCPVCNEKTILLFSQGDIKVANNQQLPTENDNGLGENQPQQQQYIPDEMLQWVLQFLNAKELFTKIRFTCQRMDKIVCTSLLSLHCQGLRINGLKFAHEILSKETQLQELNLTLNNIGDNEATEIATVFPLMQQLQILNLSWNRIRNSGANVIANSITNLTQLQRLFLSDNQFGDSGATTIAKSLKNLVQLQELFLYNNRIGDTGAIAIANTVSQLTQLQQLNLAANHIGDTGATAIANSIINLSQLQRLYLDNNLIGCTGATAIANCIVNFIQLQRLYLSKNRIGDTGAMAITNSITNLPKIFYLYLQNNNISKPVRQQLKRNFVYKLYI